jgi:hypothetical protein
MYQSEAMWISFSSDGYPFAIKIAAGKIDAITGGGWSAQLIAKPQNYLILPTQPWLDGFAVKKGVIRQFVAMPLGSGYSAEEQLTGKAEHGGLQIQVYPMRPEIYKERVEPTPRARVARFVAEPGPGSALSAPSMGLAPGGKMRQEIYEDRYGIDVWDREHTSRCFVHLCNSMVWQSITGKRPPYPPPTAKSYSAAGLPWFDYYRDDVNSLIGSQELDSLKTVSQLSQTKGDNALPENESVNLNPDQIRHLGKPRKLVREMN